MCMPVTTYLNDSRIDIDTKETDENFWKMNTFKFLEGHPYNLQDIKDNPQSLIICKSLKERIFGNEPAVGKSLVLTNVKYKIMGVVEDVSSIYMFAYSQVWFPYNFQSFQDQLRNKNFNIWTYQVAVEMKSKSNFNAARNQFKQEISKLPVPDHFKIIEADLESSSEMVYKTIGDRGPGVPLIIGFILLFSLIPLLNLTNLTVSRIFERSSEIGVRKAFGATKHQMAIQFVYENIFITLIGGILGFLGAWFLIKGLDASGLIQVGQVNFSLLVFSFGITVILIFGVVSGFYPALKMSKLQIVDSLKGGAK
jgi:putative ABC transport system permease protein